MKNIILTILRTGYSTTKKYKTDDLCKKIFFLKYIVADKENGIFCNYNKFWTTENRKNIDRLIDDVMNTRRFNIQDRHYYSMLNELANGEAYGIEKMEVTNE